MNPTPCATHRYTKWKKHAGNLYWFRLCLNCRQKQRVMRPVLRQMMERKEALYRYIDERKPTSAYISLTLDGIRRGNAHRLFYGGPVGTLVQYDHERGKTIVGFVIQEIESLMHELEWVD